MRGEYRVVYSRLKRLRGEETGLVEYREVERRNKTVDNLLQFYRK